jgi:hypothetical protein
MARTSKRSQAKQRQCRTFSSIMTIVYYNSVAYWYCFSVCVLARLGAEKGPEY